MSDLLAEICCEMGCDPGSFEEAIETAVSECLSKTLGVDAFAQFCNGSLRMYKFDADSGAVEIRPGKLHRRVSRNLVHAVKTAVLREQSSRLVNSTVQGEVFRILGNGDVMVRLDGDNGYGVCPVYNLLPRKDKALAVGDRRWWYIENIGVGKSVTLSKLNRTRNSLVASLLRMFSPKTQKIRVVERKVGEYLVLEVDSVIPHTAIHATAREIGERINFIRVGEGRRNGKTRYRRTKKG